MTGFTHATLHLIGCVSWNLCSQRRGIATLMSWY